MTTPDRQHTWSTHGLRRLATNFATQEHQGVLGSLLLRLARFLGGDPSSYVLLTSTGLANPQGLPDDVRAMSAVLHVTGGTIVYRTDGGIPVAADAPVPAGNVITLTGMPTLKGFQWAGLSGAASLVGELYD